MTTQPNPKEQLNIEDHANFNSFVSEGLRIGSHIVANKSHGKTRLMFAVASELMTLPHVRVICFDGSESWLYSFSRIPVFNVSECDIIATSRRQADTIEKYTLQNENLVKLALETHKDILFRLKTRKPSKRGFFIRTVINYLDAMQRDEKSRDPTHENKQAIAYFIEEAQNAFSSRNSASAENETFLTVFNEARNNREGFFTSSQRLTDFSKTIRSKQIQCIGKLSNEDITPNLRKLERIHGLNFADMKPRTWFYEGKTFLSPNFSQVGKPFLCNAEIKQKWLNSLPKAKTLKEKIAHWFKSFPKETKQDALNYVSSTARNESENSELSEDEKGDWLALDDDDLMFSES